MNRIIIRHQKMRAISRILENHSEIFEGKAEALVLKDNFAQQLDAAALLISEMLKPTSAIRMPKLIEQKHLELETGKMIKLGILLSIHLKNDSFQHLFKTYRKKMYSVSAYKKYEIALHVEAELSKHQAVAIEFGLTAERLLQFNTLVTDFGSMLELTGENLFQRKKGRVEMEQLLKICNETLRFKIDPLMGFYQELHPQITDEYFLARGIKTRKKKRITADKPTVEIVGTVTNATNGEPVNKAIINLIGHDVVTETDADGYYLLDDLPATTFVISCHSQGFELPTQVTLTAAPGESLVVDFVLTPSITAVA